MLMRKQLNGLATQSMTRTRYVCCAVYDTVRVHSHFLRVHKCCIQHCGEFGRALCKNSEYRAVILDKNVLRVRHCSIFFISIV